MDAEREQWIRNHPAYALDNLSRRLERAARDLPTVSAHLIEQRASISILLARCYDTNSNASTITDPTGRLIERYDQFNKQLDAILDGICTAWVCVNMLDTDMRTARNMRAPTTITDTNDPDHTPAARCIGDNTPDGAACWNIPGTRRLPNGTEIDDGRCHECGPRHDAHRRAASDARRLRRHHENLGQ